MKKRALQMSVVVAMVVGLLAYGSPAMAAQKRVSLLNTVGSPPASALGARVTKSNAPTSAWALPAATRTFTSPSISANSRAVAPQIAPSGTAVGAPGLGALPYFSFNQQALTVDTVARVNLGNGNLLLTSNDGSLDGPGEGLRNDRFYNGLSTAAGSFGGG